MLLINVHICKPGRLLIVAACSINCFEILWGEPPPMARKEPSQEQKRVLNIA